MPMIRIEDVAARVARNCRISDARSWGYHSVCGLLLRMRELYKREMGLEPWDRVDTSAVLPWIGEMEALWGRLESVPLEKIEVEGKRIDPFDAAAVNALIAPLGCFYAAGHGMAMKPLFVLGEIASRAEVEGVEVVTLGRELVADLSPAPAMNRDGTIVARREVLKWYLWERLEEAGAKRDRQLGTLALRSDGVELKALLEDPASHRAYLEGLVNREMEMVIRHEIGEIREDERAEGRWGRTFSLSCGMKAELLARGLKDVLADTGEGGRLQHMIRERALASVGLYAAFSEGLRRGLFPELGDLFARLADDGDWEKLEEARLIAHRRLRRFAEPLFALFEEEMAAEERAQRADALEEEMLG